MGLQAVKRDFDIGASQQRAHCRARVSRGIEQRRVEALKQAVVDHHLFAAATFLGGRAQKNDLTGQIGCDGRQCDRGADAAGRHRVAGRTVAQAGQRVGPARMPILGPSGPRGPPGSRARRAVGSRPAGSSTSIAVSRNCRQPCRGLVLFEEAGSGLARMRCDSSLIPFRVRLTASV